MKYSTRKRRVGGGLKEDFDQINIRLIALEEGIRQLRGNNSINTSQNQGNQGIPNDFLDTEVVIIQSDDTQYNINLNEFIQNLINKKNQLKNFPIKQEEIQNSIDELKKAKTQNDVNEALKGIKSYLKNNKIMGGKMKKTKKNRKTKKYHRK